jgi:hypothetical protein
MSSPVRHGHRVRCRCFRYAVSLSAHGNAKRKLWNQTYLVIRLALLRPILDFLYVCPGCCHERCSFACKPPPPQ